MRRLLTFLSVLLSLSSWAQVPDGSNLRISLLTCSKGDDIASDFGHSALRVTDSASGQDIVFNYGTYDFDAPHFVLKFMRGQMDYLLSVCYFDAFIDSYVWQNRAVYERELNLTPENRMRVYAALVTAYQGPGKRYRYDYFRNNCATKIRDIFIGPNSVTPKLTEPPHDPVYTFRNAYGDLYLSEVPWLMFGLDMVMGARLDRLISFDEEMYLPCLLEENLSKCRFEESGTPVLGDRKTLLDNNPVSGGRLDFLTEPMCLFSSICLIFVVLFFLISNRRRYLRIVSSIIHTVIGLTGILMLLMWFCTEHYWTGPNWNLLWASPLYLVPVFMREEKGRKILIYVLTGVSVITFLLRGFLPQQLNSADIPIVAMLFLVAVGMFFIGKDTNTKHNTTK